MFPRLGVTVTASLPGTVVELNCEKGEQVQQGDTLAVIQYAGMSAHVIAVQSGIVNRVNVSVGDNVMQNDELLTIV